MMILAPVWGSKHMHWMGMSVWGALTIYDPFLTVHEVIGDGNERCVGGIVDPKKICWQMSQDCRHMFESGSCS
jgi:hypothetical protein